MSINGLVTRVDIVFPFSSSFGILIFGSSNPDEVKYYQKCKSVALMFIIYPDICFDVYYTSRYLL